MLPVDLDIIHGSAILAIFFAWFAYPVFLKLLERRSLNAQLEIVRQQWLRNVIVRANKPFDAILLGHIINSVAFFGSATLLVLAGLLSALLALDGLHGTLGGLHFIDEISFELFALQYLVVAFVIGLSFFSFTYALRKLVYLLALIGALPDKSAEDEYEEELVIAAATVLTESTMTFNFGIRGFYYAAASLLLFVSPVASLVATVSVTLVLLYRQTGTKTSRAIRGYVDVTRKS